MNDKISDQATAIVNSRIFGKSMPLSIENKKLLMNFVEFSPIEVFAQLNKKLNKTGFAILIDRL